MEANRFYLSNKIKKIRQRTADQDYTHFANEITRLTGKTIGRGTLIRWERGQAVPHLEFIMAMADLGSTSLDSLLAPSSRLLPAEAVPRMTPTALDDIMTELSDKLNQIKNYPYPRSVAEFAAEITDTFDYQISNTKLNYWLKGQHLPNPLSLYPLAHIAGISVDELLMQPYPLELV
ncbi:hypothetical protein FD13_GL001729 [Levilactobacillus senmaizukei DSM 21775 = NBRC 103853]|uniref:HTH cro/C1-type domain-containing protein n=1 Tax=Levilactobacillus senmaizukei DSM 21775 = NBRC 103853 TaxID=1423803 RepID=A0A0R2DRN2_9LACO|nr:helix-turn-helix transcriptional regulator [Levilactobacillus senmaizukei]KRN02733.1 hypothetical protein FD13_GL001729 [Levilactobacillus senmaizukei DSM 21775 = NBRC 103853]